MDKYEEEGKKAVKHHGDIALEQKGNFDDGVEDQIVNIEEQLKKAQNTLLDLQSLKERLEVERKRNVEKEQLERERLNAIKLKAENEQLKDDLKDYHGEIDSLKHIIASLKDDLVSTTQTLQTKVADSLRILEHAESKIDQQGQLVAKKTEEVKGHEKHYISAHHNEEEDDDKPINLDEPKVKHHITEHAHTQHAQVEDKKEEEKEEKIEQVTAPAPEIPRQAEVKAEMPAPAAPAPEITPAAPVAPMAPEATNVPAPAPVIAPGLNETTSPVDDEFHAATDALNQILAQGANEEPSVDELSEYEKIKKELEAIERGDVAIIEEVKAPIPAAPRPITPQVQQTLAAPATMPTPPAPVTPAPAQAAPTQAPSPVKVEAKKEGPVKIEWKGNDPFGKEKKDKKAILSKINPLNILKKKKINKDIAEAITTTPIAPVAPSQAAPAPAVTVPTPEPPKAEQKKVEEQKDSKDDKNKGGLGKMMVKTAVVVLVLASSYFTFQIKNAGKLREAYVTQAQQNSVNNANSAKDDANDGSMLNTPPEQKYKEAYADIPLGGTTWENYADPGAGISLQYPINVSHRLKPLGSTSTWFLRKDGYLLKYEVIDTQLSLEDYVKSLNPKVVYKTEVTNFKGKVAVKLTPDEKLPIMGDTFLLKGQSGIIKVWHRTYDPNENPDDEARVQKMVESFAFTF